MRGRSIPTVGLLGLAAWGGVLGLAGCQRSPFADGLPARLDCSGCHGGAENAAPPRTVRGATATTEVAVGAHQAHLRQGTLGKPVPCEACHVVPTVMDGTLHPDPLGRPAPVVFMGLATAGQARPGWHRDRRECANTYCHGGTLRGADARPAPVWTRVDGAQKRCVSCHGNPPADGHPSEAACERCHGEVVDKDGVIKNPALHVDGVIQVSGGGHPAGYDDPALHGPDTKLGKSDCRTCHGADLRGGAGGVVGCDGCHQPGWRTNCVYCHGGTDNPTGAPPRDLRDRVPTSFVGNGAHTEHSTRTRHPAYACTQCHPDITDALTPGHLFDDTPTRSEVELTHGLSKAGTYRQPECANLYCHGDGKPDRCGPGQACSAPAVSFVPGQRMNCETCHPTAGLSEKHLIHEQSACAACHGRTVTPDTSFANPDLHVNGAIEVVLGTGTFDAATRSCSATGMDCHFNARVTW